MKKISTFIFVIFCFKSIGQFDQYSTINANAIKIWSDNTSSVIHEQFSKASGGIITNPNADNQKYLSTIFKSGINVIGYRENNFLSGLTSTFGQNEYHAAGPITDTLFNPLYNIYWKVFDWEIREHIEDFEDNQFIDNLPAANVLKWPGKNNPYSLGLQGITWEGRDFAPFYDRNNDDQYNPYDGDYPILDASCPLKIPGQMIYSIYHGLYENNFEISKLLYSFESDKNELLNNTVFVQVSVLSKFDRLTGVKLGLFNDFDLGCPDDDFLGTSIQNNTVYTYNQTEVDEILCYTGSGYINAYGENPPIQSLTCLDNNVINTMICYRESPNPALTDPHNLKEFYNILNSKWKDGTSLTYGGSGYDPLSTNYVNAVYPSSPTDENGWNMKNSVSPGIDPRMYINVDLGDLEKDSIVKVNFAYTFHPADLSADHFSRVDSMLKNISKVQSLYDDCFDSNSESEFCLTDCVWPGDTDVNGKVNNLDLLNVGVAMNKSGIQREKVSESWKAHSSDEWTDYTQETINYKHIDCNGSGNVNKTDKDVIENNFLYSNSSYVNWGGYNNPGEELTINFIKDEYLINELIKADLSIQSESVYGFGLTIEYDPVFLFNSYNYLNDFWKTSSDNPIRIVRTEPGKIHFAIVKTLGNEEDLMKQLFGTINLRVKDGIDESFETKIKYSNYEKIDAQGKISPLTSSEKTIKVNKTLSVKNINQSGIKLYPNPASNILNIDSDVEITETELVNNLGKVLPVIFKDTSCNLSNIPPGFYLLKAKDVTGKIHSDKLVIIR